MNDLGTHLLLFLAISVGIVLMSCFFSEREDGPALRTLPKRVVVFVIGCAILAAIMLACEHTFAAI